ncbi:MAG: hypothetical protein LRY35_02920, partial [Clostridiales bacterium]|nr:hypothetical protein [Clostridiales bacterium]
KNPACLEACKGLHLGLEAMREARVDSLLIIDNRRQFLGVVDVNTLQSNLKLKKTLQEIMVDWPTVGETDSVKTAVQLMVDQNVRFVPVSVTAAHSRGSSPERALSIFVLDYL